MGVTVSIGGPTDIASAVDIYARATTARRNGRQVPQFRVDEITASLHEPESWLFIARDAGVPIAMAHAMPSRGTHGHDPGDVVPGLCYLYLIFVVPERWGEGIGLQLLDHVMDDAKARGYSRIHLWTHENNNRAHRLYLRRGFARSGRTQAGQTDPDVSVNEWARDL